ncbi:hypothetical protein BGP78_06380 [Pseudoalteromonas sp. MSK9-3]|uniref:hypothetical protein n=1 Tax=Pseudoalteromonas sp. MSK9-3 TaxID=1897633 RepID=UPI000E6C0758|nr:hypothetical protein [Pseudoalteromonas sp. MSK9-3]RJE78134.1 hypothetical protein BGP78_06380 [Pseudoalteromonas sp. MSK9-3]
MATIQNAVQAMVDKLVTDMKGSTPLSAEDQALVSNAITKLADNDRLEKALVAVAEEHLDVATGELKQATSNNTSTMANATQSVNNASNTLVSRSAQLSQLDNITPAIENITKVQQQASASYVKPLFGLTPLETAGSGGENRRTTAAFAIYDNSGETHLVRPSYTANTTQEQSRIEFLTLSNDGSHKSTHFTSFVYTNAFEQNPVGKVLQYGSSAFLPLALKAAPNDIQYEVVFSSQDSVSSSVNDYGGIFCKTAGFNSITKPKKNLNAVDQWGVTTTTNYAYKTAGVLYDNNKHCLVMVDEGTSLLIEKYRDGNNITSISIPDDAALQSYVNAGDFTCVNFIYNTIVHPHGISRYNHAEGAMSSYAQNYHGYFGILNGVTKMGHNKYSAHYRFTEGKKLEPINYYFMSNSEAYKTANSSGTVNSEGEVTIALESMMGELLGMYQYRTKPESAGYSGGIVAVAVNCINPYSNVGILNEHYLHNQYGLGRTCRAF